jgi:hypothetical protein
LSFSNLKIVFISAVTSADPSLPGEIVLMRTEPLGNSTPAILVISLRAWLLLSWGVFAIAPVAEIIRRQQATENSLLPDFEMYKANEIIC